MQISQCVNPMTTQPPLDIEGEEKSIAQIHYKAICSLGLGGVGSYLMVYARASWDENNDLAQFSVGLGFILFVIALWLPAYKHVYLDFADRRIVSKVHYAWFCRSKRIRPLTDFSMIVVRHLCIPGGEGPDTYTGSVGFKPVDGKAVFWVKNFPATEDAFPHETYEFAKSLAVWTGLPGVQGAV